MVTYFTVNMRKGQTNKQRVTQTLNSNIICTYQKSEVWWRKEKVNNASDISNGRERKRALMNMFNFNMKQLCNRHESANVYNTYR